MTHTVGFISQEFNECEKSDQFDLSGTLTTNNINIAIAHTQFVCTSRVSEANFGTYARRFQEKTKTRRSRKKSVACTETHRKPKCKEEKQNCTREWLRAKKKKFG